MQMPGFLVRKPAAAAAEGRPCIERWADLGFAAPRSLHPGGVNTAQVDGSVRWISNDIESYLFARLVSINDGEGDLEGLVDQRRRRP